ncbi:methyl-accepting chemotaxis protein [Aliidiomarina soli]|uniref:Methyl-accepting chemotaxis protein n=1 Tax=Aliidiomarina soli TaxID=1928574 RepID=A0A432WGL6_9GAMM|nr:methyl-accepting chemotaxis protein [Aliidiomarina soli]RUO32924.1 methyl-accepting chemotaxis protein [Aliidiomarina soli]
MGKFFHGLTFKLLVLVVIVGSVPLSILGGFTFFMTKANMEQSLEQQLMFAAEDAATRARQLVQVSPDALATADSRARLTEQMQLASLGQQGRIRLIETSNAEVPNYHAVASVNLGSSAPLSQWRVQALLPEDALYAPVRQLNLVMWTLWVIAFITALSIGYAFARRLLRPLHALLERLTNIASGDADLTQQLDVSGEDEFAQVAAAFNRFIANLRSVVGELASTSQTLASQAQQSMHNAEQSQQALTRQHNQVDMVATAMNEMTTTVHEVAQNTQEASHSANAAISATDEGHDVVDATIRSIGNLANEVEQAAKVITALKEESVSISGILDAIRSIADQTNLLALNAAIEAARAGEAGRGFAVVADEVRTLAIRVSEATDEIHSMITKLQKSSDDAVAVMDRGQEQAAQSVSDAEQTGLALQRIREAIYQINDMNAQVAAASEEQSTVAEDINRNVVTISELAYETATQSNEVATASEQLNQLAETLQAIVRRFKY